MHGVDLDLDLPLILGGLAALLILAVVILGVVRSRRNDRAAQRARVELQHQLGERLGPPSTSHTVRLPHADAEATYQAVDELRRRSG